MKITKMKLIFCICIVWMNLCSDTDLGISPHPFFFPFMKNIKSTSLCFFLVAVLQWGCIYIFVCRMCYWSNVHLIKRKRKTVSLEVLFPAVILQFTFNLFSSESAIRLMW